MSGWRVHFTQPLSSEKVSTKRSTTLCVLHINLKYTGNFAFLPVATQFKEDTLKEIQETSNRNQSIECCPESGQVHYLLWLHWNFYSAYGKVFSLTVKTHLLNALFSLQGIYCKSYEFSKITLKSNQFLTQLLIQDRLAVVDPSPQTHLLQFAIHKIVKLQVLLKVENEISNIVHVWWSLHLLKAKSTMDNIFLSHSYILVSPPKSLFSIKLILICITLSLVTLLIVGKSFPFPLRCIVLLEKCHKFGPSFGSFHWHILPATVAPISSPA